MFRTRFIAVTGSVGKTTATSCLKQILESRFRVNGTRRGNNSGRELAAIVLRTRWWHRFAVIEVGTNLPGALRKAAWMIAPNMVVVLTVAGVHTNHFATLEDIAAEKSQLLSRLGRRGLAVLNGDDPRVAAMAAGCRSRVMLFGLSPHFDVWADEITSVWPERLAFRVHYGGESRMVRTRMVGAHWLHSVLGALTAALCAGVDLDGAVAAVAQVQPEPGRMQPLLLPNGAWILRDDFDGSYASLPAALKVLEQAPGRRVLVYRDVVDAGLAFRERTRLVGELAARAADSILLFGMNNRRARNAMIEGGARAECIRCFYHLWDVAEHLKTGVGPGDLVLLRARATDSAARIYFAQIGEVGCRLTECGRAYLCDYCVDLQLKT
jgi:UDP-N-acetylmuramyl pentapeptide synthase